jgi:hypothetical protein
MSGNRKRGCHHLLITFHYLLSTGHLFQTENPTTTTSVVLLCFYFPPSLSLFPRRKDWLTAHTADIAVADEKRRRRRWGESSTRNCASKQNKKISNSYEATACFL